jgi:hypothetical protein
MRIGGGLLITLLMAFASARGLDAQGAVAGRAPGSGGRTYTAIGCLTRLGTAAAPRYVITDRRGDNPTVYRLNGDATDLARHVGHTIEVKGPLTPAPGSSQSVLKVTALVWISSSCRYAAR